MTVSSATNKSGPYSGNGVTTVFAYGFRILDATHIQVVTTTAGVDTIVGAGAYSVSGVGNTSGGNVTFTTAPATGTTVNLIRNAPFTQGVDLENQGAYYAETVEEAFDLAAMRDQQLQEQINRSVKIPVGEDASTLNTLIEDIIRLDGSADNIDTVATNIAGVNTAATNIAAINDAPNQAAAAAGSAAAAAASYDQFDDRYLGAKATAPVLDNDGAALLTGAIYWDTGSNQMFTWDGAEWVPTFLTGNTVRSLLTATSGQTVFTTPTYRPGLNTLSVFVNGVKVLLTTDYAETTQNSITFVSGLTAGDEVEMIAVQSLAVYDLAGKNYVSRAAFIADIAYLPADGTVVTAGGVSYVRQAGATALPGLTGWLPFGVATFRHFGAAADGVTDDHAALSQAMFSTDLHIDPEGLTYKINTALNGIPGTILGDMTIDASAVTTGTAWTMTGSAFEAAVPLSANMNAGARQGNAIAHGYAAGDAVLIQSNELLETATNSLASHWAEAALPTENTFQLSHTARCIIRSTEGGNVRRLPEALDISGNVRRVKFMGRVETIGGPTCENGITATRLIRPDFGHFVSRDCTVRGLLLSQCFMPRYDRVEGYNCNRAGLGYAAAISGCGWSELGQTVGDNCRHVVTYGAASGVPCIGGTYGDVIGYRCVGSVFDTHPAVLGIVGTGTVYGDMTNDPNATDGGDGANEEAITMQGEVNVTAVLKGRSAGAGALIQPAYNPAVFSAGYYPSFKLDLDAREVAASALDGVVLQLIDNCILEEVQINARVNASVTRRGLFVNRIGTGAPQLNRLLVSGVYKSAGTRAVYIIGEGNASGFRILSVSIAGQLISGAATEEALFIIGNTLPENRMNVSLHGAHLQATNRAIRLANEVSVFGGGSVIQQAPSANSITAPALLIFNTEYGSNANGEYWLDLGSRLQTCTHALSVGTVETSGGGVFRSADTTWTYPRPFAATPNGGTANDSSSSTIWGAIRPASVNAGTVNLIAAASVASARTARVMAVGRG